ncbi:MAG: carboxynorspermidine decarboxylase [Elusimicrobiota bacterium]
MTETLRTPYYLISESKLTENLEKISIIKERSGAKIVLALKCFSTWSTFNIIRPYLDGTTSSSLYEARLGHEKFGKETHAYSVAFSEDDVKEVAKFATKIIFNSLSQFNTYKHLVQHIPIGLRINPGVSYSDFDLANPARCHSRLGVTDKKEALNLPTEISGVMFHFNCENSDFEKLSAQLDFISKEYEPLLKKLDWVSLGGGIFFTKDGYPLEAFAQKLSQFSKKFNVQIYLEPGESVVTKTGSLVTTVLDIVKNEVDIAIVDAAVETHMLDLLIYNTPAKVEGAVEKGFLYTIAGKTCLAGDIFGSTHFKNPLKVGDKIIFADASGYTMVKKNWFNGVQMPSIVIERKNGSIDLIREFNYQDYLTSLS